MATRIGSYAQNQAILQATLRTQANVVETQTQIATGKKTQSFSGLQGDSLRLLNAKGDLAKANQFLENITIAEQRLDIMLVSVQAVDEAAREMRTLFQSVQNGDGVNTIEVPTIAAQFRDQIVDALNAKDSERFLFAGAKTDTRPVVLDNGTYTAPSPPPYDAGPDLGYYEGDSTTLSVRVDNNFVVPYGFGANQDAFEKVIRALDNVAQTNFTSPPTAAELAVITSAIDDLTAAIENNGTNLTLEDIASEIALDQGLIASQRDKHDNFKAFLEDKIADIENVNTAEAVAKLNFEQTQLEASFQVIARAQRLTLNNFLSV
jgi:flagellar hook-associated protein 3 FlgL